MPSTADFQSRSGKIISAAVGGAMLTAFGVAAAFAAPAVSNGEPALQLVRVHMHDIAFVPQTITVAPGTTIEWTNDDDMAHTVTSGVDRDDGAWTSSPLIPPGGTFRAVLSKPGRYRYFCKPHVYSAAMHATIVVENGATSAVIH